MRVFVDVTYTLNVALALLLVASTLNRWFPASYSANWIETVSEATVGVDAICEGVVLEATAVSVLVGVGSTSVGVREGVAVGATSVGVVDGLTAIGVGVRVGVGVAIR